MILAIALTVIVTVALTAALAKAGPLDHPRARSPHSWPTATSGGLAMIAGTAAGIMAFLILEHPDPGLGRVKWMIAGATTVALLGALDDIFDVPPWLKLIVQIVVSLGFTMLVARADLLPIAPGIELDFGFLGGAVGAALWLVVIMNAFNFMDGSDGLASGVQAIGLFTLALINPDRPILAFTLLAAGVANVVFLPFNHPGRRIFQGDCGALFSSFLIGAATVLQATGTNSVGTLYMGVFVAAPFLTDALLTLLQRARTGKRLLEAHNEHLYQRWTRLGGRSASALAWRVWGLTAVCAAIGFGVERWNAEWSLPVLLVVIAALSTGWFMLDRRYRIQPTPAG